MSRFILAVALVTLMSCAHPRRVSRRSVRRLAKEHKPFVLVFGSLSTTTPEVAHPVIRFVHQTTRSAPEYLLWSLTISSGDRFYAVLQAPPQLANLDEFYAEVGDGSSSFDRIDYVRLRKGEAPLAMYVGEIRVSPARNRSAQGEKIAVNVGDDFESAAKELKRLYPDFEGPVVKTPLLRNPRRQAAPPERVR
ncbi:MAG TPA: hypothetical protein VG345_12215 [Bryobacteraceae bacterium]|nr:hypothetical protein [Bryobacteraceae bacterium]